MSLHQTPVSHPPQVFDARIPLAVDYIHTVKIHRKLCVHNSGAVHHNALKNENKSILVKMIVALTPQNK